MLPVVGRTDHSIAGLPRATAAAYLLLFLAAFVSSTTLWPQAPVEEGDSPQYLEVARDLSDFSLDALHVRTPGYPLLLALTGSTQEPTRSLFFVSLILHFLSIWLLAVVLHSAGATRWLMIFCGVLLLPPYVEPAAQVMTENLAQFMLVAGFVSLVLWFSRTSGWLIAASGLAFGLAALTRPIYQVLVVALSVCLLVFPVVLRRYALTYQDAVKASGGLVAGTLLVVGGVAFLNQLKFNYFGLTPTLGFHLSTKTMSVVERLPDEYAVAREILIRARDAEITKRGGPHTGTQTIWSARAELEAATGLTMPQLSSYLVRMNLTLIRRAPLEYLQEVARVLPGYWFPPAGHLANMNSSVLRWSWMILHVILVSAFWLQIIVFAGVTIFEASKRLGVSHISDRAPAIQPSARQAVSYLLAGTIVFYTMALSCVMDIGEMRQRRSTEILIVFMAFLGAHVWETIIRSAAAPDAAGVAGSSLGRGPGT